MLSVQVHSVLPSSLWRLSGSYLSWPGCPLALSTATQSELSPSSPPTSRPARRRLTRWGIWPSSGRWDWRQTELRGELMLRYGPSLSARWLVWGHDIFGPDSGRTKEYCQDISQELGLTCILPDFFRGLSWPDELPTPPSWEGNEAGSIREDWEFKLLPYLIERGAQSVAVVGTCFGSYVVIHTSADSMGLVKAGVGIHPSHPGADHFGHEVPHVTSLTELMEMTGEDEATVYSTIQSPQYFMATPDSSASVRPGGLAEETIERTVFDEYEEPCGHGFFNRGDLADPAVAACVSQAWQHLTHFLTGAMWHCVFVTLCLCDIVSLWHCDTITLCLCDTVSLWHWVAVTLWHCVYVTLWYCDTSLGIKLSLCVSREMVVSLSSINDVGERG